MNSKLAEWLKPAAGYLLAMILAFLAAKYGITPAPVIVPPVSPSIHFHYPNAEDFTATAKPERK
jgi:hypothetical protein